MEKNTRRGFLAAMRLEGVLAAAKSKLMGHSSHNLNVVNRKDLEQLVGIRLPSGNPDDPNCKMLGQYLDEHNDGSFVYRYGPVIGFDPGSGNTYLVDEKVNVWCVPVWARNELKEIGVQFIDYPDQHKGRPRPKEQVDELRKLYT